MGKKKITSSLQDLLTAGKTSKCTWETKTEASEAKGVTYVDKDKFRTEMTVKAADIEEMDSFMIGDGTWYYMWGSATPQGTKIKISDLPAPEEQADEQGNESSSFTKDINTQFDYDCEAWSADSSFFVPPENIEFIDFGEQMKVMTEQAEKMTESACEICAKLPESLQSDCLANCE